MTTYLIQYGRPGFLGRFRSALALARGERAVVRTVRGTELGEVMLALDGAGDDGDVLRLATPDDEAAATRAGDTAQELLAAAADGAIEHALPLTFVDVETTLDGFAILHALPWDACDATALLDQLAARFGLAVRLLDLSRSPTAKDEPSTGGCGKPGCGTESGGGCSTGGGCSSGGCSRGAVKSADELTAHFAALRRQMEAAGLARTPLN
ncbi:Uncharacterized protein OS=Blastopirellula marina DSM 3645 GN=DSM3645_23751 PE=4 SV=1 [Gemmataceae bacterium]|nr:Uncharacterized protein OS=Blastopirellula marina DSM 3645 GN=DSM3645_23751 PE=4 SV=1 [Gemmataceae bacterium]VTT96362.1 Uncharacterized protein OS=Blastopirellula marina DSM 3645 GN=DSM3645_23751 PE=4 SV=1 [Gemmataceae bacterium]